MSNPDALIDELCAAAAPVKRIAPIWLQAAIAVPAMLALGWLATAISHRAVTRWEVPEPGIGMASAALSLLIGAAAFAWSLSMSVAGRKVPGRAWIALALAAWLAVAVAGIGTPVGLSEAYRDGRTCFVFIVVAGLPMIAVVIAALRRTRSLHPRSALVTAGGSVAFLSFGLLSFCHPATTTIADTAGHLAAAAVLGVLVVALGRKAVAI